MKWQGSLRFVYKNHDLGPHDVAQLFYDVSGNSLTVFAQLLSSWRIYLIEKDTSIPLFFVAC